MNIFFKLFGWLFALLSLVSAALQYNDPDPLLWIFIYALTALISVAFALGKASPKILLASGIIGIIGFFFVFPTKFQGFEIGSGDIKNIEEGREAMGLLIIAVVMFVFAIWRWYMNKLKV